MGMQTKKDFKYATLFDAKTGEYCSEGVGADLVMGPETAKRFEENDDCAVTVCCITYNHEHLIRQALDSFLMQKTNFKFKVFVGEDNGPDGTADVIREYAEKYPDIIVPFLRTENMGAQTNLIDICNHATSPYIAFCEGDDFWIDEYKLQKQYDYMQAHEDVRMCYTNTEILAPEDWHLNDYYKHEKDGRIVMPGCTPGFKKKPYYLASDFVSISPSHTSSAFYRWNYDLDIPSWFYEGLIGDAPITILQMGKGKAVYLPDVTSVYRRSDVGVFMNKDHLEHFANTRLDYVRFLSGLRKYFFAHFGGYMDGIYRFRITREIANYLNTAKSYQNDAMVRELFDRFPEEAFEAMHTFLGSYNIYASLQRKLKPKGAALIGQTKWGFVSVYPTIWLYAFMRSFVGALKTLKKGFDRYIVGWYRYWKNTGVKKQKNLWVFTGFRHANYMDNCMYFYDYVVENHPEIEAVWLTTNKDIYAQLKAEHKPVMRLDSKKGSRLFAKAEIAVTDHFVMSDFSPLYGFNNKTKVVQLWHGVGFKSMGDANGVRNTAERGVQYSNDIIAEKGDNIFKRMAKGVKYFFLAPFRERFEQYYLFVCPGQERIDMIADVWHVAQEARFMAGHPRDILVYGAERQTDPVKVMYAPTYRFDPQREATMVQEMLEFAPQIQTLMEEINGEFYLRMHPHTWRNYRAKIENVLKEYDRVFLHDAKDVYTELGTFSVVISDYSSIALDFALLDRPVIFHGADYDWFVKNEAGFNLDFPSVIPGPMTADWEETLQKVREYYDDPAKDAQLREEKLKYFFDKSVNGADNSERIVAELKRRLELN